MSEVFADAFNYIALLNPTDALTDDHHFVQAGFQALLQSWR